MENSEVKIAFFGREFGLMVKEKLEEAGFQLVEQVSEDTDVIIVASYGSILSKEMLEQPRYGALNVHPSLLPKYRGPAPVPAAILNGDEETGVTVIQMDEEIDHGPILAQQKIAITGKPTTEELLKILWDLGGDLLLELVPKWIAGEITPREQDHSKATYTKKLSREDGEVDWLKPVEYIERQVRAFSPWPGAYTFWKGKRVKILKAHIEQEKLIIDELQLEGKKPTTLREFLLGHKDFHVGP